MILEIKGFYSVIQKCNTQQSWVWTNLRRRYIVMNTERSLATAICKSAPHIAFEILRDHGHLVTQSRANEYFLGVFLSVRGLKQLASILYEPLYIVQYTWNNFSFRLFFFLKY